MNDKITLERVFDELDLLYRVFNEPLKGIQLELDRYNFIEQLDPIINKLMEGVNECNNRY